MTRDASDRNVYILGAGFSAEANAPLIYDFLARAREFLDNPESGLDRRESEQFAEVFKFRSDAARVREKFRIDLDNIEELFGLVEMSHRLGTIGTGTRDSTVYLIAKTLQLAIAGRSHRPTVRMSLQPGYAQQAESFINFVRRASGGSDVFETDIYTHFALLVAGKYDDQRKLGNRSSTVITFNYDLVLDDALTRVRVRPEYELDNPQFDEPSESSVAVSLLKLHGSTNWAICSDSKCNRIHVLSQKATSDPDMFRSKTCATCGKSDLRLLLVPPSWDKSEYSRVMQPVWKKAVAALKNATRICVIGYSMPETDAFFKFLLTLGLAENDGLYKLVVVDLPGPNLPGHREVHSIDLRWREMLEGVFAERRYKFHPEGTANFLQAGICPELRRGEQISHFMP
jgi:hypothetical protein